MAVKNATRNLKGKAVPEFTLTRTERRKCGLWLSGISAAMKYTIANENSALTQLFMAGPVDVQEQIKALEMLAAGRIGEFETWWRARHG